MGKCENILKEKYNISLDIPLLIFKLDIDMEGYSAPAVEYEIYNPITKEKLNLKYCNDEQISMSIPVSIDENELFKYNLKSEFYNDICSTYTTNYKTDITLNDRQKEFINKNMTLCENDCHYDSYDYILKKVECICDVKYRIKELYEIKIDKDKLKANLNIKNLVNKCYKKVFTKKGLFHNIGSYILLSIIFLYIVSLIYLIIKDYSMLKKDIDEIFTDWHTEIDMIEFKIKENENNLYKTKTSIDPINSKIMEKDISNPSPILKEILYKNNKKIIKNKGKKQSLKQISRMITQDNKFKKIKKKFPENLFLTECVLNESSYKKALLYDKRTFFQYFCSLLKSEHLLFFAIIPTKDYNSKSIKICIFLFSFALFFSDNAIFMNEDAIHNIYENQGTFDYIYQIPQIVYSNIISFVIDKIIRFLSLSQGDVIEEKKKRIREKKSLNSIKFFRVVLIKYFLFFIISFCFLFLIWFYISCFCFVYKTHTLKSSKRNYLYIVSKLLLF